MSSLRTQETEEKIMKEWAKPKTADGTCALCGKEAIKKEFKYWKITDNSFPYDLIASTHHMLVIKRHVPEQELTQEEKDEFEDIKHHYIHDNYEYIMEATFRKKSIPDHFHIHLLIIKERKFMKGN